MKHRHCSESETQNCVWWLFGIIFVVEIEQKQAMCLKRLLINFLFFELL